MDAIRTFALLGSGLAVGLGAIGTAVGLGFIAMKAVETLGRQPRLGGKALRLMLIAQAVTETSAIFALVVSLVLIFQKTEGLPLVKGFTFLAAGIAIGFGTIGSGFGAGLPGGAACEGLGKQPGNSAQITVNMLIGQAVTQTSSIFSLTIALILITLNPTTGLLKICAVLGAGIAMGFGAIGPGIGDGIVAFNANRAIAKDARNMGVLTQTMLIGQAVTETTDIYSIVVALILIFVV